MDEFFENYFEEEIKVDKKSDKDNELDEFFEDYFEEEEEIVEDKDIKEIISEEDEEVIEGNDSEVDEFFEDYFEEEYEDVESIKVKNGNSKGILGVTQEDAIEDKKEFLSNNQQEHLEGEIEWSSEAEQKKVYNELSDGISFNKLLVREKVDIDIPESKKEETKETQRERVERLINNKLPKKRYKPPVKPIPIKIPYHLSFYGAPPTEKSPIIINPIKEINEDFSAGLELGEIREEDYELLVEYEKRLADRKAQKDIAKKYKESNKTIAPSVSKEKRVGIGPLDNEIAMNMPCTPDGKTLSDLLAERNSDLVGTEYIDNNILDEKSILNKAADREIFREPDYDINRYTRVIEKEEGKAALRASRELLATERNSYRKRSRYNFEYKTGVSEYTSEERLLADTLGVTPKKLMGLMSSDSKLTSKEREKLLGIGVIKRTSYFGKDKETKIDTTFYDRNVLEFLKTFKYSTLSLLSNIDGINEIEMEGILQRMKKSGLISNEILPGVGAIWFLTRTGGAFVDYQMSYITKKKFPSFISMEPALGVMYLASHLWNNRFNVLNLDDFPYHGKIIGGEIVRGETLISESQIKSSMYKFFYNENGEKTVTGNKGDFTRYVTQKGEELWRDWLLRGGESPEMTSGNEFLYGIYPQDPRTSLYHLPDLVIQRPRYSDGSPASIAIEVEKKMSTVEQYFKVMLAYRLDKRLYEKVIWVTNSSYNAKLIDRGARRAQMVPGKDYDIIPFLTPRGGILVDKFWKLGVNP